MVTSTAETVGAQEVGLLSLLRKSAGAPLSLDSVVARGGAESGASILTGKYLLRTTSFVHNVYPVKTLKRFTYEFTVRSIQQ